MDEFIDSCLKNSPDEISIFDLMCSTLFTFFSEGVSEGGGSN